MAYLRWGRSSLKLWRGKQSRVGGLWVASDGNVVAEIFECREGREKELHIKRREKRS